jgi:hypothetical protein
MRDLVNAAEPNADSLQGYDAAAGGSRLTVDLQPDPGADAWRALARSAALAAAAGVGLIATRSGEELAAAGRIDNAASQFRVDDSSGESGDVSARVTVGVVAPHESGGPTIEQIESGEVLILVEEPVDHKTLRFLMGDGRG